MVNGPENAPEHVMSDGKKPRDRKKIFNNPLNKY